MKRFIWLLIFFYAATAGAVESGKFYAQGSSQKPQISLTFDDGPGLFTEQVLDLLGRYQIKATFFMNGDQVQIRPALAMEVKKRGHEIAEHTFSHMNFHAYEKKHGRQATEQKVREEMRKSQEQIQKHVGLKPTLCRMPHGYHRPWLGAVAQEFGYALVNWSFGEDWLNISEEKMLRDYEKAVKPGAILLFHDGGRHREKTLHVVEKIIPYIQSKNLTCVTASELLK